MYIAYPLPQKQPEDKLEKAMIKLLDITLKTDDFRIKWAADAIASYIDRGDANLAWQRAFTRANIKQLLDYVASGRDLSDKGLIARADSYIRKHHRMI